MIKETEINNVLSYFAKQDRYTLIEQLVGYPTDCSIDLFCYMYLNKLICAPCTAIHFSISIH